MAKAGWQFSPLAISTVSRIRSVAQLTCLGMHTARKKGEMRVEMGVGK